MPQPGLSTSVYKTALIALGANATSTFGPPYFTVKEAISRLAGDSLTIGEISHFYHTPAFPPGSGPEFVNAAVQVDTSMGAGDLLAHLHQIEAALGRERAVRWGPRVIDLDLIDYDGQVLPDADTYQHWRDLPLDAQKNHAPDRLILPHPRVQDRAFVLGPICDIAPEWVHPVLGQTAKALYDALPVAEKAALTPIGAHDKSGSQEP